MIENQECICKEEVQLDVKPMDNPKIRLYLGVLSVFVAIFAMLVGGWPLIAVSMAFLSIGALEYKKLIQKIGVSPFFYIVAIVSSAILTATIFQQSKYIPFLIFLGIFMTFGAILISKREPYIPVIATTILGILFCWLPCHIILLSQLAKTHYHIYGNDINVGIIYTILLFGTVIATDFGAYFFGSKFGKKKLIPEISPNKTVVGAVAGGISAIIVASLLGKIMGLSAFNSFVAGFLITICAQFGDFSVSILKRGAGIKHSGDLFLDRGGLLDRLDSFIFSAPVTYYYFKYFSYINFSYIIDLVKKVF